MQIGFDKNLYLKKQTEGLLKRTSLFPDKLYLEFGGKLFDDYHAARILPGFDPNLKVEFLQTLKDKLEVVFCISAKDIEHGKVREDSRMSYEKEMLRQIECIRKLGINVSSIVITFYTGQKMADVFMSKLKDMGETVYLHCPTKGYPSDAETIVSEEGYGKNPYIKTSAQIVVVSAPGPGSGKLGTCLCNMYHDFKAGRIAGYAKFETFPVWNLSLKHPLNVAYETATAELGDVNMIDPYHFAAYKKRVVNYNRDIESFPILRAVLEKITKGPSVYKSPTDMGINAIGFAITNDALIRQASKQEIIRRYYNINCNHKLGLVGPEVVQRMKELMSKLKLSPEKDRPIVKIANDTYKTTGKNNVVIQLKTGEIIIGKEKEHLCSSAAAIVNAIKKLAGISDNIKLIPENILSPICNFKKSALKETDANLGLNETLVALSLTAQLNDTVKKALDKLPELSGCEAHANYMLSEYNVKLLKRLGINITMEPRYKKQ